MMREHPAYASYIRTSRDAIVGTLSNQGEFGIIRRALRRGANTYDDLIAETGYSRGHLHRRLRQLIKAGLVITEIEATRGNFRPRKLFFLTKNKAAPQKQ